MCVGGTDGGWHGGEWNEWRMEKGEGVVKGGGRKEGEKGVRVEGEGAGGREGGREWWWK